jgi:SAM-dependent methyltransferase
MRKLRMKLLKKIALALFKMKIVSRPIVLSALRLHNLSYKTAGHFSIYLEPDGLHPKHRLMKYHDWFAQRLQPDWDVLDVGCGNGALAYDLKDHCASVMAIDVNSKNIEWAIKQFASNKINYICGDATNYAFQKGFNAIILSNVLEHIDDRVNFIKHLYTNQNRKKPPVLLLRVPMLTRDWITLYKKEVGVEWKLDPTHYTEFTIEQLNQELSQAGMRVESHDIMFGEFYGIVRRTISQ